MAKNMKSCFFFAIKFFINMACICFVGWKSTQCFIKFLNKPQGINLGIKDAAKTDRFPMLTVCGVDSDEEYGMRWNLSHLSHCGIQGDGKEYANGANWVGVGDEKCTNPKKLWESVIAKLKDLISYVEIEYYDDGSEVEISSPSVESFNELNWALSIEDSSSGRCFSIMPSVQVIRKGISEVKIGMPSLCKVYIHTPGVGVKHAGRFSTYLRSDMRKKLSYVVESELYELFDDGGEPCNNDPLYDQDNCIMEAFDKLALETFGCTTPFGPNKDRICIDKTIGLKVMKLYTDWFERGQGQDKSNCSTSCQFILTKAIKTEEKPKSSSELKFFFPDRVKMIRSTVIYSGLELVAEVGGYVGLFLGVSFNQITILISYAIERIQNHEF